MVDRRPSGQAASGKDTVISSQVAVRSRREWSRRESSDIDEARKGERAGASASIKARTCARSQRVSDSENHIDEARRVSERERANGASGTRCDIDAAKRRSQTENWEVRVNQSKSEQSQ